MVENFYILCYFYNCNNFIFRYNKLIDQFVIPKDKVITIVEVAEDVEVFYHMSLRKLNTDFITDAKGKISTVDEARIKLNKIFNKDS